MNSVSSTRSSTFKKDDLQRDAQQYSDQSFTDGQSDYYTARTSMTKLRRSMYVEERPCGRDGCIYLLTNIGKQVAAVIYAQHHGQAVPKLPSFGDEVSFKVQCFIVDLLIGGLPLYAPSRWK